MPKPCPHCSELNEDNATICSHCGKAIETEADHTGPEKEAENKNKTNIIIGVVVVCVIVLGVLFLIFKGSIFPGPEKLTKKAYQCVVNNDSAGFTEISYDANFSKKYADKGDDYAKMIIAAKGDAAPSEFKIKDIRVNKLNQEEVQKQKAEWSSDYNDTDSITDISSVDYTIESAGSSFGGKAYAVKTNGKWYISSFMVLTADSSFGGFSYVPGK